MRSPDLSVSDASAVGHDARARRAGSGRRALRHGAVTLALGAHYIIRDLDDAGPHLILLAMMVGGGVLVLARVQRPRRRAVRIGDRLEAAVRPPAALLPLEEAMAARGIDLAGDRGLVDAADALDGAGQLVTASVGVGGECLTGDRGKRSAHSEPVAVHRRSLPERLRGP